MFQTPWTVQIDSDPSINLGSCVLSTSKLQITTSPFSLYPFVDWTCSMPAGFIESGYLVIGAAFTFTFVPEAVKKITRTFKVLSIDVIPTQSSLALSTDVHLTLTIPAYFDQQASSKAYRGRGSDILKQVYGEDFPTGVVDIDDSVDSPHTLYRTNQTPFSFVQQRVTPYCMGIDKGPYFVYSTADGVFRGRSYQTSMATHTTIELSDVSHPKTKTSRTSINSKYTAMYALRLTANNQLWNILQQPLYHMIRHDYSVKPGESTPTINPFTRTTSSENRFALVHPSKEQVVSKTITDDSLNFYENIYSSITQSTSKDLLSAQVFTVTCAMNIEVEAGDSCDLIFNSQTDNRVSIFAGKYVIVEATKMFQGTKSWMVLTLSAPGFSYEKESTVLKFFHTIKSR